MALRLVPTSQFKKDYKRARKRGLDMGELQEVLASSAPRSRSRSAIETMRSRDAMRASANAMFALIGCWYMQLTRIGWSLSRREPGRIPTCLTSN